MKNTRYEMRDARYENGFAIAELLIALAITGLLLVAVTVAFNASITNYRENEDIFKTINTARQALHRITSRLRDANSVACIDSPDNECSLETANGAFVTYRYDNDDSKLYLDANGDSYVLCDNVTAMTFKKDTAAGDAYVKSVQISMTVESGNVQRALSAAAVIRRNLK